MCAKADLSSVFLWFRKWYLHIVSCLTKSLGIALCFSLSPSPIYNLSASSLVFTSKIFFLFLYIYPAHHHPKPIHNNSLDNDPFLQPFLAIYLLPSVHSDDINLSTRSYLSSIENFQWFPIMLGIKHKLHDMAGKSTSAPVFANFTYLISHFSFLAFFTLLWLSLFSHHASCCPSSFFGCYFFLLLKLFFCSFLWRIPHNSDINSYKPSSKRSSLTDLFLPALYYLLLLAIRTYCSVTSAC